MSKEEQEEIVDFWDGIEVEEEIENETGMELEEEEDTSEDEEEDLEDQESEEDDPIFDEEDDEDAGGESEDEDEDLEEEPLVVSLQKKIGYEFDEEFEDTEEGVQRLVESASQKLADDTIDAIFSEFPDVKELFEYRRMGGDPDTFFQTKFPEVDFDKVEFEEDNEAQHEELVKRELAERGYSQQEISAELEDYKNGGILENKAKRALSALKAKQQEQQESLLEQQRREHKQRKQQIAQYWEEVREDIEKSSSLKGFKIPSKDKEPFFDYISKPVENGLSQREIDAQQADRETKLAIDYLLYKGFNIGDIIDRKAKDKNAKSLRERIKQAKLDRKSSEKQSAGGGELEELGAI